MSTASRKPVGPLAGPEVFAQQKDENFESGPPPIQKGQLHLGGQPSGSQRVLKRGRLFLGTIIPYRLAHGNA